MSLENWRRTSKKNSSLHALNVRVFWYPWSTVKGDSCSHCAVQWVEGFRHCQSSIVHTRLARYFKILSYWIDNVIQKVIEWQRSLFLTATRNRILWIATFRSTKRNVLVCKSKTLHRDQKFRQRLFIVIQLPNL